MSVDDELRNRAAQAAAEALRHAEKTGKKWAKARANLEELTAERNEAILAAALWGIPQLHIARAAGLTAERVRQIIGNAQMQDMPPGPPPISPRTNLHRYPIGDPRRLDR